MTDSSAIRQVQLSRVVLILRNQWDPIGGGEMQHLPQDEYDSYAPEVLDLLTRNANNLALATHLAQLERVVLGLTRAAPERLLPVAEALREAVVEEVVVGDAIEVSVFIERAIARGSTGGLGGLSQTERRVFMISEAEVLCDMEGFDSFLDAYTSDDVEALARAFAWIGARRIAGAVHAVARELPKRDDGLLERANDLIAAREGYSHDSIVRSVTRWFGRN